MKKETKLYLIVGVVCIILVILVIIALQNSSKTGSAWYSAPIPSEQNSEPEVYFCPQDNCGSRAAERILSANNTVHCALYSLSIQSVKDALIFQSERGVDVKLITDYDNYKKVQELGFAKSNKGEQLTHNKFCVIDGNTVFTGSFNPTVTGDLQDNNNLVVFYSQYLSQNYEDEFNELWNGVYGAGDKVKNSVVILNGYTIENYFCPEDKCQEHVLEELKNAKQSIKFMTYSFTDDSIGKLLIEEHGSGIDVSGVFEKSQISEWSEYSKLKDAGIDVRIDGSKGLMHHKVFIIDNTTVITGSYNPTQNGNENNDENIVIIHDEELAGMFLKEFGRVY